MYGAHQIGIDGQRRLGRQPLDQGFKVGQVIANLADHQGPQARIHFLGRPVCFGTDFPGVRNGRFFGRSGFSRLFRRRHRRQLHGVPNPLRLGPAAIAQFAGKTHQRRNRRIVEFAGPAQHPRAHLGQRAGRQPEDLFQRFAELDLPRDHAVHQLLHAPGEIADFGRADHPAAAFQGMESAADLRKRLAVAAVAQPCGQAFLDPGLHRVELLQEDVQHGGIDRHSVIGGRFRRTRHVFNFGLTAVGRRCRQHCVVGRSGQAGQPVGHDFQEARAVGLLVAAAGQVQFQRANRIGQGFEIREVLLRVAGSGQRLFEALRQPVCQGRNVALRCHAERTGNLLKRGCVIRVAVTVQPPADGFLHLVQAGDAFIQQAGKDALLFDLHEGARARGRSVFDRFAEQPDVGVEDGFDLEQFLGQRQEWGVEVQVGTAAGVRQRRQQFLDSLRRDRQIEHFERIGELLQRRPAGLALLRVDPARAQLHVQRVLDLTQFFANRFADRMEQVGVPTGHRSARPQQRVPIRDQFVEPESLAQEIRGLAAGARLGGVEQQCAGQGRDRVARRPPLAALGHGLQRQVEPGEQAAQCQIIVHRAVAQALNRLVRNPPKAPQFVTPEVRVKLAADPLHRFEQRIPGLFLEPAQQGALVEAADSP